MTLPENKTLYRLSKDFILFWSLAVAGAGAGACWYFTRSLNASLAAGGAAVLVCWASWRILWWKIQEGLFVELQLFLMRCKLLPDNYKLIRHTTPLTIGPTKQELMDAGYEQVQESLKKLHETRHVLDKFVGTKASQFATQKGIKAVWEGELSRAIVLFSDVRGFTTMSEKLKPQETVRYLNRMFTEFEEVIAFSGGEINKFMGDAILAFFPLPAESPEAAVKKALLAALRMQDGFHQIQGTFKEHYSESIQTGLGIGMAGGDVVIGNLGSARRMEFTLIGDTVNLASRLCAIAEDGQILINQDLAHIAGDQFRMEAMEPVRIKGKTGTYRPYVVMGERLQQGLA
jgi:class 3 adenylate cyclase